MIRMGFFDVRNVLITIIIALSIYGIFSILKWYIRMRIRNRRIFKILSTFKSPPHIPIFGHALEFIGTPTYIHNKFFNKCDAYGPDFMGWLLHRVFVILGKPENVEKVLTSQSCLEKNEMYIALRMVGGTGLITAPVEKWRHTRKIINPTFNTKVLEGYQQIFASCTSTFVNEILPKNLGNGEVDWYTLFLMLNMDILIQSSLGVDHDIQRKQFDISESFEVCLRSMFLRAIVIFYRPDFIFYRLGIGKTLLKNRRTLWNYVEKIIQERKQKFQEDLVNNQCQSFLEDDSTTVSHFKKPFLDCLLELDHRGMNFSDQDLKDEVTTFFMAGTDTTTITECFFLTMMGMHPDIQERVYEEARTVFGSDSAPSMQDLKKLEYLDRCLKESLRLFPTVPIFFRENTGKDLKLSDCVIPKGVSIGVPVLFIHRSELYWVDPLKYDPDRFLPDQVAKRHQYTYLPFSGGFRGCIGQKYAYNVMKTTLGLLLTKYKVHCDAYKSIEEIKLKSSIVIKPEKDFKFWFEKRKSTS